MIAYLAGEVKARTERGCVLLTSGGVGYELYLTAPSQASLPGPGNPAEFHVYTIVREDALELYGFDTWDERVTFDALLSIQRLGAKTAQAILSIFSPDDLRRVALSDDYTSLTRVPGIGKKSAQRIFLELKYKLQVETGKAAAAPELSGRAASVFRDALAGLANLGYDETDAGRVLEEVFDSDPDLDVSEALRAALKNLAKKNK
jgi:Holliday junction DNA helicase RuvA